ncbi:M48 family metallopeptidase [Legionella micdadei]|uniref:Zinc metalloprotease n=1 Tax=Legionella micdadei TaxID=451 RepID=A0A098GD62_LEGMI|nr:SprT family zinc-dependent metalloprotease [Legionella micdadei]ARG98406.1 zinc metalloprotease [Legionella micdadei]ARH01156.1 zinc metalloprotease [Legionella micdadei]KTD30388.1 zinc metalloprotease [Legionella micdadei]NSL18337.1 M48 family metallopeptidase [Legionella micdadei]CEG59912.1 Zinc metalloprotease [Legionella micdadei]
MTKNFLELDGIPIEILRKPIKNIYFRIYPPDGDVKISAPLRLHLNLIRNQIEAKRTWILTQRAKFKTQTPKLPMTFESGEQHEFLGKKYTLIIHEDMKHSKIVIEDGYIHCYIKSQPTPADKQKLLENWYRQQMKEHLPSLISKWESRIGVKANSWRIRVMRTRWGSCNTLKKRIWLNLNLIKKPSECLEYVLVHELIHLLEASHNRRFYTFMDQFLPQWRDIKVLLTQ